MKNLGKIANYIFDGAMIAIGIGCTILGGCSTVADIQDSRKTVIPFVPAEDVRDATDKEGEDA